MSCIFLAKKKLIYFKIYIYTILYILYMCTYRSFSTAVDKGLRKNNNNKKRQTNWKILTRWSGSTEYETEKVKQTK